jgi:hypothetical protein
LLLVGACAPSADGDDLLGEVSAASSARSYAVYATTNGGVRATSIAPGSIDCRMLPLSDGSIELVVADTATDEHLDLVLDTQSRVRSTSGKLAASRAQLQVLSADLVAANQQVLAPTEDDARCALGGAAVTVGCAARVAISASSSSALRVDTTIATCVTSAARCDDR